MRHKEHQRGGWAVELEWVPAINPDTMEDLKCQWTPGGPFLATVKSHVDRGQLLVLVQDRSCQTPREDPLRGPARKAKRVLSLTFRPRCTMIQVLSLLPWLVARALKQWKRGTRGMSPWFLKGESTQGQDDTKETRRALFSRRPQTEAGTTFRDASAVPTSAPALQHTC